jgi:hypothetical protein
MTRTPEDYAAALDHTRAHMRCPSCGGKRWQPLGISSLTVRGHDNALRIHIAVCQDCGFVRQHAAEKLGA